MSGLKNVIIALPTGKMQQQRLQFATSILVDKIKMEKLPLPEPIVIKQEQPPGPRAKKRRLDHLTWEEKLQRKKLKNRVAAQTSRDRKKAKLDELEDTVQILKDSNEHLTEECSKLRTQNELLLSEITKLKRDREASKVDDPTKQVCSMCQARVGCTVPTLGSAAGWNSTDGKSSDTTSKGQPTTQHPDPLPALEDLFCDFQGDEYIERLEELAESILREVTTGVETNSDQRDEQNIVKEEVPEKSNNTEEMVGQTSSDVETSASSSNLAVEQTCHSSQVIPDNTFTSIPTITLNSSEPMEIAEQVEIKEEPVHDAEMVYGTYDEATNCITIIYPEDDVNRLAPNQYVSQNSPSYDSMSPASSYHSEDAEPTSSKLDGLHSDGGYESHGSPESSLNDVNNDSLTNLWHESFSELFPSLI